MTITDDTLALAREANRSPFTCTWDGMTAYNPNLEPCFQCGGEHRHIPGCALDHAGGYIQRGETYIVRSALGEYWIGNSPDGPFTAFYKTPSEVLAAVQA